MLLVPPVSCYNINDYDGQHTGYDDDILLDGDIRMDDEYSGDEDFIGLEFDKSKEYALAKIVVAGTVIVVVGTAVAVAAVATAPVSLPASAAATPAAGAAILAAKAGTGAAAAGAPAIIAPFIGAAGAKTAMAGVIAALTKLITASGATAISFVTFKSIIKRTDLYKKYDCDWKRIVEAVMTNREDALVYKAMYDVLERDGQLEYLEENPESTIEPLGIDKFRRLFTQWVRTDNTVRPWKPPRADLDDDLIHDDDQLVDDSIFADGYPYVLFDPDYEPPSYPPIPDVDTDSLAPVPIPRVIPNQPDDAVIHQFDDDYIVNGGNPPRPPVPDEHTEKPADDAQVYDDDVVVYPHAPGRLSLEQFHALTTNMRPFPIVEPTDANKLKLIMTDPAMAVEYNFVYKKYLAGEIKLPDYEEEDRYSPEWKALYLVYSRYRWFLRDSGNHLDRVHTLIDLVQFPFIDFRHVII